MDQQSNKKDQEMVNFIREERHDFFNYLQVILGYLQLNKTDRAVQYIKQVTGEMQEQSSVTKIENPYLVLVLLFAFQKAKNLGIRLSLAIESGSSLTENSCGSMITDQIIGIIELVFQGIGMQDGEDRQVEIRLKEVDHHIIMVIAGVTPLTAKDLRKQIEGLLKQNLLGGGSLEPEKSLDEIEVVFQVSKHK